MVRVGVMRTRNGGLNVFRVTCRRRIERLLQPRQRAISNLVAGTGSALFLSPVWPERTSSAAGVRSSELFDAFRSWGYSVSYGAAATPNDHTQLLAGQGVPTYQVALNRRHELEATLDLACPDVVVFDRFYCEEYFSFVVREKTPAALRVLDMQDMHCLRGAREALVKQGASVAEVLACRPDADDADCLRELAAIHRSDLTLVCSPVELDLLVGHYGVPEHKLALAPLFYPKSPYAPYSIDASSSEGGQICPGFEQRQHCMMIGNFLHKPNLDSVRQACALWPAVRQRLPSGSSRAELHIYGAYPPGSAVQQFHRPRDGIYLKGFAPSLDVMLSYRLLFAPLRFGAGLKGKVADAWWYGLPVITTMVGAEGMDLAAQLRQRQQDVGPADSAGDGLIWQEGPDGNSSNCSSSSNEGSWGGLCSSCTAEDLAGDAARLYADHELWGRCQLAGFRLLRQLYDRDSTLGVVCQAVAGARAGLAGRRAGDYFGSMLWQQQHRATEYFSRYIELKESLRVKP